MQRYNNFETRPLNAASARHRLRLGSANLALRSSALVARFALSIYLTKFLALTEVGLFGILNGVIGVAPALLGFGLNYYLNREIVDIPIVRAAQKIRDRIGLTVILAIASIGVVSCSIKYGLISGPPISLQIATIVLLEILAFDLHMCLVALRLPLLANAVVFVRTAAWVVPFVGLGLLLPKFRTFETLLDFWEGGLCASLALLAWHVRGWPWKEITELPVDRDWLLNHFRSAWLIYASDIGIAFFQFADRFVISIVLGLLLTGVYTFYWTIANSIQLLINTAVIQVALPRLVAAYRNDGLDGWINTIRIELITVSVVGVALSALIFAAVFLAVPYLGRPILTQFPLLFPFMLMGVLAKVVSDVANLGLYSRGLDRAYAWINISGIFLSLVVSVICIKLIGLLGAGISMTLTGSLLFGARLLCIARAYRNERGLQ